MRFRNIINYCINQGWQPTRIKGGHLIMTKDGRRSVPIPIHGEGLPEFIIKKELEQEPPKSKVVSAPEVPVEDVAEEISQVSLKQKPVKKPLETDGVEMFPSKEEAEMGRQEREKAKEELFSKAIATFIEDEDFAESAVLLEELLQNYSQFLSIEERAEVTYLLAYSWFFNIWNEKEGSQEYLYAMERTCELCKTMYSEDQHKNSGIKELITTIAEYLMNMVEVEFIKIAFRKHNKKYKNSKVVISLLRAFEFILKQDIEGVDKPRIYIACLYLCVEALIGKNKKSAEYYEKGWSFYSSAKANRHLFTNFEVVESLYLQYVLFVVDAYKERKLKGTKFADLIQVQMLINEATKFASEEFVLGAIKFDHWHIVNKQPRVGSEFYKSTQALVEKFNQIPPAKNADYLETRLELNWLQICANYEYSEELTEISGTWAKYLECRMDIIKYKELYEKDLQIWKRIPDVYAAELRCPSIPQYEILLLHYDRQVVDIINNNLQDIWNRAVSILNYIGHNPNKLTRLQKSKFESIQNLYSKSYTYFLKNKDRVGELALKTTYNAEEMKISREHLEFMIEIRNFGKQYWGVKR